MLVFFSDSQKPRVEYAELIDRAASAVQAVLTGGGGKPKAVTPKQLQELVDSCVKKLGELLRKSKVLFTKKMKKKQQCTTIVTFCRT